MLLLFLTVKNKTGSADNEYGCLILLVRGNQNARKKPWDIMNITVKLYNNHINSQHQW